MNAKPSSRHLTLAQARYRAAFGFAQDAKNKLTDFSRYVVLVKKYPAMVNSNGLGQALAYLEAKKSKEGKEANAEGCLLAHLEQWLTRSAANQDLYGCYTPPLAVDYRPGCLLEAIRHGDSKGYVRATVETLQLLNYLRLAADGLAKEASHEPNHPA